VTHGASLAGDEFRGAGRDIGAIVVRRAGALVTTPEATVPYAVTDADGSEVDAFAGYLRHVTAGDFSGLSIRSYGLALFCDGCARLIRVRLTADGERRLTRLAPAHLDELQHLAPVLDQLLTRWNRPATAAPAPPFPLP
jgi:hypothetical protein